VTLVKEVERFIKMVTVFLNQRFNVCFELVKTLGFIDKCQALAISLDGILSTFCKKVL